MKFLSSDKAEAEVIGHFIIIGIIILSIGMITLYGVPVILSLQDMNRVEHVEQAFTVLDSRASRGILGEAPVQITDITLGGGRLNVVPNGTGSESYMVIKSKNNTFVITVPMGKIKYQLGDRIVGYEGGGVWSKYPSGRTIMLSPPEFHYNGVTLTLPIININGTSSIGGSGVAKISLEDKGRPLVEYPNTSCAGCANRTNPVNFTVNGKVYANITSDYYDAWADFAETLGFIKVLKVNPATRTASLELSVVPSTFGGRTYITNPIVFRGLDTSDPTPLDNFSFNIVLYGNPPWNLNWDIRAKSGNKTLIFHLKGTGLQVGDKVDLSVGYEESGYSDGETWEGDDLFVVKPGGYVEVDLLNKSIDLTYEFESVGADNAQNCQPFGGKIQGISNPDFSWENIALYPNSNSTDIYNITQHYFWKMAPEGDITFSQCSPSGQGNKAPAAGSTMVVNYNVTGALTYLHVTRNNLDVAIS